YGAGLRRDSDPRRVAGRPACPRRREHRGRVPGDRAGGRRADRVRRRVPPGGPDAQPGDPRQWRKDLPVPRRERPGPWRVRPDVRRRGGRARDRLRHAAGGPLSEGGRVMGTVELTNVSRWYGNVVAVNDVTMKLGPGVTGLLGPNGAGKTTVLHMMSGFLAPSQGSVNVDGRSAWRNPDVYRTLGLVSEREAVHGFLTGGEFVLASARLHQLPAPAAAARRAIELVDMREAQDRRMQTYSKGMRQRTRVAAALVHEPRILL